MKILILNGSPRSQGLISQMLKLMAQEAETLSAQVEWVTINRLLMRPCLGCMNCRTKHVCVLPKDDAHKTMEKINEADVLIVGTPCYWGNMNGYLKVLFDRIVYGLIEDGKDGKLIPRPLQKGKKAIIITTITTPWPWDLLFSQSSGAARSVAKILRLSGYSIVGTLKKGDTRRQTSWSEKEIKRGRDLIRRLSK